jgi:hypothetical protein
MKYYVNARADRMDPTKPIRVKECLRIEHTYSLWKYIQDQRSSWQGRGGVAE